MNPIYFQVTSGFNHKPEMTQNRYFSANEQTDAQMKLELDQLKPWKQGVDHKLTMLQSQQTLPANLNLSSSDSATILSQIAAL